MKVTFGGATYFVSWSRNTRMLTELITEVRYDEEGNPIEAVSYDHELLTTCKIFVPASNPQEKAQLLFEQMIRLNPFEADDKEKARKYALEAVLNKAFPPYLTLMNKKREMHNQAVLARIENPTPEQLEKLSKDMLPSVTQEDINRVNELYVKGLIPQPYKPHQDLAKKAKMNKECRAAFYEAFRLLTKNPKWGKLPLETNVQNNESVEAPGSAVTGGTVGS